MNDQVMASELMFVTYRRLWPGWEWFTWRQASAGEVPLLLATGFVLRRRNVMRAARRDWHSDGQVED
jgi:hypothetical protein